MRMWRVEVLGKYDDPGMFWSGLYQGGGGDQGPKLGYAESYHDISDTQRHPVLHDEVSFNLIRKFIYDNKSHFGFPSIRLAKRWIPHNVANELIWLRKCEKVNPMVLSCYDAESTCSLVTQTQMVSYQAMRLFHVPLENLWDVEESVLEDWACKALQGLDTPHPVG